jgi:hypothetical protein
MDPIGVTIGGTGLFLQILEAIDRLWHIYEAIANFQADYRSEQVELRMQWRRFDHLINSARLPESRLPGGRLSSDDKVLIEEYLRKMEKHFDECNRLIERYTGHGESSYSAS